MHDLTSWMSADFSPAKRLVFIGGEIDSSASERAVKALLWLESEGDDPIHVYLNSEGGDWYEGFAIYDAIRGCKSAVTITATGYCMSMASIILQAGDERLLTPNAR
jgi:ATP-dependent Clp protease protease subunit